MHAIDLLRRLTHFGRPVQPATDSAPEPEPQIQPSDAGSDGLAAAAAQVPAHGKPAKPSVPIACPSCGFLVNPPPARNRRCPHCRQTIVVRRFESRTVYLAESAVAAFEAARKHEADVKRWEAERLRWLRLASSVAAPEARITKLAGSPITAQVVEQSRVLYLLAADREIKAARHEKRWVDLATIREHQAAALWAAAGSPMPPPDDIVALSREGKAAVLRFLASQSPRVELVSSGCCRACAVDDGRTFKVTDELRTPRLPHAACSKGLCSCTWWVAIGIERKKRKRRRAATTAIDSGGAAADGPPADALFDDVDTMVEGFADLDSDPGAEGEAAASRAAETDAVLDALADVFAAEAAAATTGSAPVTGDPTAAT